MRNRDKNNAKRAASRAGGEGFLIPHGWGFVQEKLGGGGHADRPAEGLEGWSVGRGGRWRERRQAARPMISQEVVTVPRLVAASDPGLSSAGL